MKKFCVIIFILTLKQFCLGQLNKGTWLLGGSGLFTSNKYVITNGSLQNQLNFQLSPNIGYFFKEKFVLGLSPSFIKTRSVPEDISNGYSDFNAFRFGPFVRYYFLDSRKVINLFTRLEYQYGLDQQLNPYLHQVSSKGDINTFSGNVGLVGFFNSSVALELMLGYYRDNENIKSSYLLD